MAWRRRELHTRTVFGREAPGWRGGRPNTPALKKERAAFASALINDDDDK